MKVSMTKCSRSLYLKLMSLQAQFCRGMFHDTLHVYSIHVFLFCLDLRLDVLERKTLACTSAM